MEPKLLDHDDGVNLSAELRELMVDLLVASPAFQGALQLELRRLRLQGNYRLFIDSASIREE